MSRFGDAIAYAQQNPGLTLNDLLTELGYQDPGARISLRAQLRRALAPGGPHRQLAEDGAIRPGPEDQGAKWAEGLAIGQTKHPIVLRSKAFGDLYALDTSAFPAKVADHIGRLQELNLTGRKGLTVSSYVLVSTGHMELLQTRIDGLESEKAAHVNLIETLKDEVSFLRLLVKPGDGTPMPRE